MIIAVIKQLENLAQKLGAETTRHHATDTTNEMDETIDRVPVTQKEWQTFVDLCTDKPMSFVDLCTVTRWRDQRVKVLIMKAKRRAKKDPEFRFMNINDANNVALWFIPSHKVFERLQHGGPIPVGKREYVPDEDEDEDED